MPTRRQRATVFKPPSGAAVVEKTAQGKPAVYQRGGQRFYAPDSTMYKIGFETQDEFRRAQLAGKGPPYVTVQTEKGVAHIGRDTAQNLVRLKGEAQISSSSASPFSFWVRMHCFTSLWPRSEERTAWTAPQVRQNALVPHPAGPWSA